jgi:tRNA dimethylallyltransferase
VKERFFKTQTFCLTRPRAALYDRINQRVDQMVAMGLQAEAQLLFPHRKLPALQTVGYQEWFSHFEGKTTAEQAIAEIKKNTRRYAKRQLTWLKNIKSKKFETGEKDETLQHVLALIK